MENNINLDELIINEGQEFDESSATIESGDKAVDTLDTLISHVKETGIMPGSKIDLPDSDDVAMSKENAEMNMIQKLALEKMKKEQEAFQKLKDSEKLIAYLIQGEQQRFMQKYGYQMSGKQFRSVKRNIMKQWKAGKYKGWVEKYGDDVLFELNKASNTMANNATNSQPVTNAKDIMNPLG